jgi:rhodanese-related sulfurtransferase
MKQHNSDFVQLVQDARSRIQEIDIHETKMQLEQTLIIDVRENDEWAAGHLPNAIHLSKGIIERDIRTHVPDENTAIITYCGGGSRSALVSDNLQKMGYTNVRSMAGGFRGWHAAGYPISE